MDCRYSLWYALAIMIASLLADGYQARRDQRYPDAKRAYAKALEVSRDANDLGALATSLTRLGGIERDLHNTATALDLYQQAVSILRGQHGHDQPLSLAHAVRHVADIALELNQLELADPCYQEALAIYRAQPDVGTLDLANALRGYALFKAATGQTQLAISAWQEAGALYNLAWQEPNSPYTEADLAPGVAESTAQIALLSAR